MRCRPALAMLTLLLANEAAAQSATPLPAASRDPRMTEAGAPSPPVGPCQLHENLLRIRINPGSLFSLPFGWPGSRPDSMPGLRALHEQCVVELDRMPPLIQWDGRGAGMRPVGQKTHVDPDRPDLRNRPSPTASGELDRVSR